MICEWYIELDYGTNIEFTIVDLDLENSPECEYDALVIAVDANYTNKIATYCDRKNNATVTSNGHAMYVKFHTDTSHSGRGFYATYRTTQLGK